MKNYKCTSESCDLRAVLYNAKNVTVQNFLSIFLFVLRVLPVHNYFRVLLSVCVQPDNNMLFYGFR